MITEKPQKTPNHLYVNEAGLLNLNCNKAFMILGWKNILNFETTLKFTANLYEKYFKKKNLEKISLKQINMYKRKLEK